MLMADAFAITMIHLGVLIVFPGCWVLYSALFPKALDRGHERLRKMPIITFLVGLGVAAVVLVPIVVLANVGVQWLSGIIGGAGVIWALFGIAPMAKYVGTRLSTKGDAPWKAHLRGGVFLLFPCIIPFLGWFFFFPLLLLIGLGAGTVAVFKRREIVNPSLDPAPVDQEKAEMIA